MAIPWLVALPWAAPGPPNGGLRRPWANYENVVLLGMIGGSLLLAGLAYSAIRKRDNNVGNPVEDPNWTTTVGMILSGLWPIQLVAALVLTAP
jgi:hypothetical protein